MTKKIKLYGSLAIVGIILLLLSPFFRISEIDIIGNNKLTEGDILKAAGYEGKMNIFAFSKRQATKNMNENPYIANVRIDKNYFTRKVTINLMERKVSGYVKYDSANYLFVDKEGRILEINSYFSESLPVIEGLKFNEGFTLGELLKVDNKGAFDTMVALAGLFEKYEIEQDVIRVDVSDEREIHFFYGNIDVQLGTREDLDRKVRYAITILPEIDDMKQTGGYLFLQDLKNPPRFKINS